MDNTHPLKTKWTLWEHRSKDPDDERWMDQFYPVATVDSVEKLWLLWSHYPKPSVLFAGNEKGAPPPLLKRGDRTSRVLGMCFFKDPVPPETKATNGDGIAWTGLRSILDIDTSFEELPLYDKMWERLVLTVAGSKDGGKDGGKEVLSSNDLNGVWLANRTRKGFLTPSIRLRLELWWASHLNETEVEELQKKLGTAMNHNTLLQDLIWRIR